MGSEFEERGYCILESLILEHRRQVLLTHVLEISPLAQYSRGDKQVPGTPAVYADLQIERLLDELVPRIEQIASTPLYPTYSYLRVYKRGDRLERHKDRSACEISVSLSLGYDPDEIWPLWIESGFGPQAVCLRRGDAVVYKGTDMFHWRDPFPGNYAAQVFLHYVKQSGPYNDWKFDKRGALGLPPRLKAGAMRG